MIDIEEEVRSVGNSRLKNRTPVGSAVDKELFKQLKEYSQETDIPMSKLLDRSIEMYLMLGNSIDKELFKQLKEYSQEADVPMSKLLDRSIEIYLKSVQRL